jgi:hypothetical protein
MSKAAQRRMCDLEIAAKDQPSGKSRHPFGSLMHVCNSSREALGSSTNRGGKDLREQKLPKAPNESMNRQMLLVETWEGLVEHSDSPSEAE